MSYGNPSQQPRRAKGGSGIFFLIILAIGAFLIFSNRGAPQPDGDVIPSGSRVEQESEEILGKDDDVAGGKKMPTTGGTGSASGWEMDDVATQKNAKTTDRTKAESSKTTKGDWAIEEVERKKGDDQFKFSDQKNSQPAKSKDGDWAIEEVKKNKKTESGDWAIEETTASDKDK